MLLTIIEKARRKTLAKFGRIQTNSFVFDIVFFYFVCIFFCHDQMISCPILLFYVDSNVNPLSIFKFCLNLTNFN